MEMVPSIPHVSAVQPKIDGFFCPVCKKESRQFKPFPPKASRQRPNVQCPHCLSLERHRLLRPYFVHRTNLLSMPIKKMLHFAPEPSFAKIFSKSRFIDYTCADLVPKKYMPKETLCMDMTAIQFPDNYFDVIYCSHILEHIDDDIKAMSELLRVLKPTGWAVLQVPILRKVTYEDPSIKTDEGRLKAFGQRDHVRIYGLDYIERLRSAGFEVRIDYYGQEISPEQAEYTRIDKNEGIYFCTIP